LLLCLGLAGGSFVAHLFGLQQERLGLAGLGFAAGQPLPGRLDGSHELFDGYGGHLGFSFACLH